MAKTDCTVRLPDGLAHTFMAARALEDAATEAGYEVKVKPGGRGRDQNRLTLGYC